MREADKGKTHRVTVSSRSCLSSFRIGAGEKQGNSLRRTGWGLNMSGILCCLSGSLQLLLPPWSVFCSLHSWSSLLLFSMCLHCRRLTLTSPALRQVQVYSWHAHSMLFFSLKWSSPQTLPRPFAHNCVILERQETCPTQSHGLHSKYWMNVYCVGEDILLIVKGEEHTTLKGTGSERSQESSLALLGTLNAFKGVEKRTSEPEWPNYLDKDPID